MMEPSHYLDFEVLKYSNYPELLSIQDQMDQIDAFGMALNTAIAHYTDGTTDKVYLDMRELKEHISLTREVLEVLGTSSKPCYDILIPLRAVLETFYGVVANYRIYGNTYIDLPPRVVWEGV